MRTITISEQDAAQVQAILNVHAELQDGRINELGPILTRLRREEADNEDAQDTADDIEAQLEVFEEDAENLKRISQLFN